VTLRPTHFRNSRSVCYGVLLSGDWAFNHSLCRALASRISRKHACGIFLTVDHVSGTNTQNFDLRRLRLAKHSASPKDTLPYFCVRAICHGALKHDMSTLFISLNISSIYSTSQIQTKSRCNCKIFFFNVIF